MLPLTHRQESLHIAYLSAVAALAGIVVSFTGSSDDYGLDGTFRLLTRHADPKTRKDYLTKTGYPLDFQAKATSDCRPLKTKSNDSISYYCTREAYNKLVESNAENAVPTILIVFCMPSSESGWVEQSPDRLAINGACYWEYVTGAATTKDKTIRLSRTGYNGRSSKERWEVVAYDRHKAIR